jgi:hypothetical protein
LDGFGHSIFQTHLKPILVGHMTDRSGQISRDPGMAPTLQKRLASVVNQKMKMKNEIDKQQPHHF